MATKQRLQRFQYRKEVGKTTATVYSIDLKFGFSKREESLLKAAKYIEKKKKPIIGVKKFMIKKKIFPGSYFLAM